MTIDAAVTHEPSPRTESRSLDAMLLQPPPGDLTGPYPALAYLKAYAARDGYRVSVRDLGIEALHYLAQESRVRRLLGRAEALQRQLESESVSGHADWNRHAALISAGGLGLEPDLVGKAMRAMQDRETFYDYRRYRRACRILESFYRLLSAVHAPTVLAPAEYPTIGALESFEAILAHRDPAVNPYASFYEEVLLPEIAAANPSVVGISMVFASQSVQALALARLVKDRFPEIHVTLGGAYLSQWVLLLDDPRLEAVFRFADSIVCGEGEKAFAELLERVVSGQSLESAPNLVFPDRQASTFHRPTTLEYTDLADLPPPDFSDLDCSSYLAPELIIPYCISRGCYWGRCAFCQNRYGDNRMRRYQTVPVGKALAEMSWLAQRHGSDHFNFSNDALDPGYAKRFCKAAREHGKRFVWNTDLRAEKAFTAERCRDMARAGLNCVAIGFESGCQKTLDAMDKGYRVGIVRQVFKNLHDSGVATQAMGIFGFPGESGQDGAQTVRFLEENAEFVSYYVMGLLMVMPGSRLYDDPGRYGITSLTYENNPLKAPEPVWRSPLRMSRETASSLYNRLGRLEAVYEINEYPYVGALSTNHSFLYYLRYGPDILKTLKGQQNERVLRSRHLFSVADGQRRKALFRAAVPHLNLPYTVRPLASPTGQVRDDQKQTANHRSGVSEAKLSYLIDPVNAPVLVDPFQARFLRRVDGRRTLKAILEEIPQVPPHQMASFIMTLISTDLLDLSGI